jgi:hypothetical protein
MGNFLPSLVQCTNVPTPSSLTKQKLQCYTVILSRLYDFKKSKSCTDNTIDATNRGDSLEALTMKDQETQTSQEKGVVRVKVLLTKREAAQLLSMSVKGDKTIGQIMSELKKINLHEKSLRSRIGMWRPVLESIPEDELVPSAC